MCAGGTNKLRHKTEWRQVVIPQCVTSKSLELLLYGSKVLKVHFLFYDYVFNYHSMDVFYTEVNGGGGKVTAWCMKNMLISLSHYSHVNSLHVIITVTKTTLNDT